MAVKKTKKRPSFIKNKHLSVLDSYEELGNSMHLDAVKNDSRFADLTIEQLRKTLFYYESVASNRPRVKAVREIDMMLG